MLKKSKIIRQGQGLRVGSWKEKGERKMIVMVGDMLNALSEKSFPVALHRVTKNIQPRESITFKFKAPVQGKRNLLIDL